MHKIRKQNQTLGRGKILIAKPFMVDSLFEKSVVLITDYHKTGTIGFILNQPVKTNVKELLADFPKSESQVHIGGPVSTNTIHYLHTAGKIVDGAKEVFPGLYWGGDFDKLKFLISNNVIKDSNIRFYVGYSGWTPGQLEEEIKEDQSWIIAKGDLNYIFNRVSSTQLWEKAMKNKGSNFEIMADGVKQINMN